MLPFVGSSEPKPPLALDAASSFGSGSTGQIEHRQCVFEEYYPQGGIGEQSCESRVSPHVDVAAFRSFLMHGDKPQRRALSASPC